MTFSTIRVAMGASGRRVLNPLDPSLNPDFANVELLLNNGNGTEGNKDMTDMSLRSRVTTWVSTAAQMDTDIERFVGVPTLTVNGQTSYRHHPNSFPQFGTQDFVVEGWIYPHATQLNNPHRIISKFETTGRRAWMIQRLSNDTLNFTATENGTTTIHNITTILTAPQEQWTWFAFQREGNNFTWYVQGNRDAAPIVNSAGIHAGGTARLNICANGSASEYRGNVGPLRITLGQALFLGSPLTVPVPFKAWPVDLLELETSPNKLQLEGSTDNILLEDSSGVLVLEGTGDTLLLEDGSGSLALD